MYNVHAPLHLYTPAETLYTRLCYTCVSVASGGCYNKNTLTPSRYCMRFTITAKPSNTLTMGYMLVIFLWKYYGVIFLRKHYGVIFLHKIRYVRL